MFNTFSISRVTQASPGLRFCVYSQAMCSPDVALAVLRCSKATTAKSGRVLGVQYVSISRRPNRTVILSFHNPAENAIRPFVIGRKNWLFSATVQGAKSSANLYSLIETAKANGLEPYEYLRQVFTELPKADSPEKIEALM